MWAGKCPPGEEDDSQYDPGGLAQLDAKHAGIPVMVGKGENSGSR